ncbi:MAG TPA: 23S rRNA (pseudouridine(1915)-N(3))-methyltransferase RlmH, partial [Pyrinomonadaceae bacterium]|nr:23S rRNA (pseudouridine(1915)-N(3))-methyltransferase RlmH [Pyrinomonadaceae bacterium]
FIWTGKTRDARLRSLIEEYRERLGHFVRCEITELRETAGRDPKLGIEKDSKRISDALHAGTVAVLLDPDGSEWTSPQLADEVRRWNGNGTKEVTFIIGGPLGVSREFAAVVDKRWSLSRLTFTHELARALVLEQLYRAYTIVHGLPYQK